MVNYFMGCEMLIYRVQKTDFCFLRDGDKE